MDQFRKVELYLTQEFFDEANGGSALNRQIHDAVGYLSMWGITSPRHVNVRITGGRRGELNASYRDKDGNQTFFMAAIRDSDGNYSFHS